MSRDATNGTVYLLHFDPPLEHAKHYLGWTSRPVEERLAEHVKGRGSSLVSAAVRASCAVSLVRTWSEVDRNFERDLKNGGGLTRRCPICRPEHNVRAAASMARTRAKRREREMAVAV